MRIKRGFKARRRRKKVLKLAKGFRGGHSKLFRTAADSVDKALQLCLSGPQTTQTPVPSAVDRPHQRRRAYERSVLQPLYQRFEKGRCESGSQGACRSGSIRPLRVCPDCRAGVSAGLSRVFLSRPCRPSIPPAVFPLCNRETTAFPIPPAGGMGGENPLTIQSDDCGKHHRTDLCGCHAGSGFGDRCRSGRPAFYPVSGQKGAHHALFEKHFPASRRSASPGRQAGQRNQAFAGRCL
jgi:hypothetical protein